MLLKLVVFPREPGRGVCGGVVSGSVGGCAECVAVTDGTEPRVGVGLFTTLPVCCVDDCVVTEHAELDRAGLAGGAWEVLVAAEAPAVTGVWVALIGDGTWDGT